MQMQIPAQCGTDRPSTEILIRDIRLIRRGKIDDEGLRFAKRPAPVGV